VRWTDGVTGNSLPTPGTGDGSKYARKLTRSDSKFFERPIDWRCSRKEPSGGCKQPSVTYGQYEYVSSELANDIRVAYISRKYPWLVAVARYRIVYKRPQDYDLGHLMFPSFAVPGEHVIQYLWRGYRDCFDVMLTAGNTPPVLVTESLWVKVDHCQYRDFELPSNLKHKCVVVPPDGDISQCLKNCDGQRSCSALNVVPFENPSLVRFSDDVNIPYSTRKCRQSTIAQTASPDSLVCYGFSPSSDPEVGTQYTISDDPRDPVFYSTCYRKELVSRIEAPQGDSAAGVTQAPQWRFGDQCISCADAVANAITPTMKASQWKLARECKLCNALGNSTA